MSRKFILVLFLSATTGYVSLSQEIIWMRAISFATGGTPNVFGNVLGFFLLGIAFGALLSKKISKSDDVYLSYVIAYMLSGSAAIYFFSLPLGAYCLTFSVNLGYAILYLAVLVVALMIGGIFPLMCHLGIDRTAKIGEPLSYIYTANIIGAVLGPLVTGFFLLNFLSLVNCILLLSVATIAVAATLIQMSSERKRKKNFELVFLGAAVAIMILSQNYFYSDFLEKLQYKDSYKAKLPFKYVYQNRSGIITVEASDGGDKIFGNGVYDGRFNLDPVVNSNGIRRAYMAVSSLVREPREVLEIGFSSGSWARVIADYPLVNKLTIVEINKSYTDLVRNYPDIATVLDDTIVSIHVDDGRRWLNRHPEAKFDLILMNTTFHWRSHSTNLLSIEFMRILKSHLNPGGAIFLNATDSPDVPFTVGQVFNYVTKYHNHIAGSDHPFDIDSYKRSMNLLQFSHNGKPVFSHNRVEISETLTRMANAHFPELQKAFGDQSKLWIITEDNMATEFKRPMRERLLNRHPKYRWSTIFKRIKAVGSGSAE